MLPGFRFLFGAIVLCFSIMIFGLGAAALLRAAHEQFASRPSWQSTPGAMLAQQNEPLAQQSEASRAVLALLEVEPDDKDPPRETLHDSTQDQGLQPSDETTAADPAAGSSSDTEKLAAPGRPEEPAPAATIEAALTDPITPEPEKTARLETATSLGEASAAVERADPPIASEPEITTAAVSETPSKTLEPVTASSESTYAPVIKSEPSVPAPQIAALGGSLEAADAQAREKEASATRAKAYRNFIRNRLRAHRAARERRRLAHRANIARRATVQQQQQQQQQQLPAPFTPLPSLATPYRF